MTESVISTMLSETPETLVVPLFVSFLALGLSWLAWKRIQFVRCIDQLPGLPRKAGKDFGPIVGHVKWLLREARGVVPGQPEALASVPAFLRAIHQGGFADKGLIALWIFNPWVVPVAGASVTVFDPHLVQQLLTDPQNTRKLIKTRRVFDTAKALLGGSFLEMNDGPVWKHQRKLTAPAFRQAMLDHAHQVCLNLLQQHVYPIVDNEGSETYSLMVKLTAEMIGLVGFSHSFGAFSDQPVLFRHIHCILQEMYQRYIGLPG